MKILYVTANDDQYLILIIVGAVSLAILYFIISLASRSASIKEQLKINNRLLIELLKKQGVTGDEISKAINPYWHPDQGPQKQDFE